MDASLVTPGEVMGSVEQYEAGDGVHVLDGRIYACIVGARTFDKQPDEHAAATGQPSGKVRHRRFCPSEPHRLCLFNSRPPRPLHRVNSLVCP